MLPAAVANSDRRRRHFVEAILALGDGELAQVRLLVVVHVQIGEDKEGGVGPGKVGDVLGTFGEVVPRADAVRIERVGLPHHSLEVLGDKVRAHLKADACDDGVKVPVDARIQPPHSEAALEAGLLTVVRVDVELGRALLVDVGRHGAVQRPQDPRPEGGPGVNVGDADAAEVVAVEPGVQKDGRPVVVAAPPLDVGECALEGDFAHPTFFVFVDEGGGVVRPTEDDAGTSGGAEVGPPGAKAEDDVGVLEVRADQRSGRQLEELDREFGHRARGVGADEFDLGAVEVVAGGQPHSPDAAEQNQLSELDGRGDEKGAQMEFGKGSDGALGTVGLVQDDRSLGHSVVAGGAGHDDDVEPRGSLFAGGPGSALSDAENHRLQVDVPVRHFGPFAE